MSEYETRSDHLGKFAHILKKKKQKINKKKFKNLENLKRLQEKIVVSKILI